MHTIHQPVHQLVSEHIVCHMTQRMKHYLSISSTMEGIKYDMEEPQNILLRAPSLKTLCCVTILCETFLQGKSTGQIKEETIGHVSHRDAATVGNIDP